MAAGNETIGAQRAAKKTKGATRAPFSKVADGGYGSASFMRDAPPFYRVGGRRRAGVQQYGGLGPP